MTQSNLLFGVISIVAVADLALGVMIGVRYGTPKVRQDIIDVYVSLRSDILAFLSNEPTAKVNLSPWTLFPLTGSVYNQGWIYSLPVRLNVYVMSQWVSEYAIQESWFTAFISRGRNFIR